MTELAGAGTDEVQTHFSYTLGSALENLTLLGTGAVNGTGNAAANILIGNSANNVLNGGTGADQMRGGAGDDTYYVQYGGVDYQDVSGDQIVELANGGVDSVFVSITENLTSGRMGLFVLSANIENATVVGSQATSLIGNGQNNRLVGGSGNDSLSAPNSGYSNDTMDGGAGADQMAGFLGDDIYYVDNAGDTIDERDWFGDSPGYDRVFSSVSWVTSIHFPSLEEITLTGTQAINSTGSVSSNRLVGNVAINTLSGLAGNDVLNGGGGNDNLNGGAGVDTYEYDTGGGLDSIVDVADGNIVRFGAGIAVASVAARSTLVNGVSHINVYFKNGAGAEIAGQGLQFDLAAGGASPVSQFVFEGGASRTLADLMSAQGLSAAAAEMPLSVGLVGVAPFADFA